jgi:hypothetical protein
VANGGAIEIGGQRVVLPVPPGYVDAQSLPPSVLAFFDVQSISTNRTVAAFVNISDVPSLRAGTQTLSSPYGIVSVPAELEELSISEDLFAKAADVLPNKLMEALEQLEHDDAVQRDISKRFSTFVGEPIRAMIKTHPRGGFRRDPDIIGLSYVMEYRVEHELLSKSYFAGNAVAYVHVGSKVLVLTVVDPATEPNLMLVRSTVMKWADEIITANKRGE